MFGAPAFQIVKVESFGEMVFALLEIGRVTPQFVFYRMALHCATLQQHRFATNATRASAILHTEVPL
jgi:hypothetical protein